MSTEHSLEGASAPASDSDTTASDSVAGKGPREPLLFQRKVLQASAGAPADAGGSTSGVVLLIEFHKLLDIQATCDALEPQRAMVGPIELVLRLADLDRWIQALVGTAIPSDDAACAKLGAELTAKIADATRLHADIVARLAQTGASS